MEEGLTGKNSKDPKNGQKTLKTTKMAVIAMRKNKPYDLKQTIFGDPPRPEEPKILKLHLDVHEGAGIGLTIPLGKYNQFEQSENFTWMYIYLGEKRLSHKHTTRTRKMNLRNIRSLRDTKGTQLKQVILQRRKVSQVVISESRMTLPRTSLHNGFHIHRTFERKGCCHGSNLMRTRRYERKDLF